MAGWLKAGPSMPSRRYKSALALGTMPYHWLDMSSIPTITEWIENALMTTAVRPKLRDNLWEELEQWVVKATEVQVSDPLLSGWVCRELNSVL
jgi:hypothetical protein